MLTVQQIDTKAVIYFTTLQPPGHISKTTMLFTKTLFLDLIGECGLIYSGPLFLDGAFSKARPFWFKGRH